MSDMHDPYEDQLSAARCKAERDQARQELARFGAERDLARQELVASREYAHDMEDENEYLRDMLNDVAWKLGIAHVVHYHSEDNYQECHKRVLDKISKLTSPTSYDVAQATTSAYDLLPEEDRDAIAWVRDHGGLDEVKRQRRDSVPRAAHERNLAKRQRQVDESHAALRRRNRWIAELEHLLCKEMSHSLRRDAGCLAPEALDADGVECSVGDAVWWVHNKTGNFRIIRIDKHGKCAIHDDDPDEPCGMTVPSTELTHQRPVLDADGVEIRVGDRLYDTDTGCGRTVRAVNDNGTVEFEGYENRGWFVRFLTHRAPVLAADGKPLRAGETVYSTENGAGFTVIAIDAGSAEVHVRWGYDFEDKTGTIAAKLLTHERPDSWERLEEDAWDDDCEYFGRDMNDCKGCPASRQDIDDFYCDENEKARDLVRRARALAERGQ